VGARGPAPKPALTIVREGNPGKHGKERLEGGVKLRPEAPDEPDWLVLFPPVRGERALESESKVARELARAEWRRVVPVLDAQGLLATVDRQVLVDYCTVVARLTLAERDISRRGLTLSGPQGEKLNPHVTAATQYRTAQHRYMGQLGLTPVSRDQLRPRDGGPQEDDPFD